MITLKEFQDYIDSFNKEKGQYTINELLSIGVKFKELPLKQRNWESLHQLLGVYNMSAEAYRKRVERYIRCNPDKIEPKVEGDIFRNDYLEKQKVRDWYNAYRRDIRQESRVENLIDEIKNAANKFEPLKIDIKPNNYVYKDDVEAIALLSDWHIGQYSNNFYNKYDQDIAVERVNKLTENLIHYCKLNKVKTLHVLNLGDLIEGLINTNARIEQQMDVAEQLMFAGELLANCLLHLSNNLNHVTYRSVTDNHSRLIPDKRQHIEKENLYRIIDWFIKERLKNSSVEFIEDNIDIGFGLFELKNGMKIAFMHGHEDQKCKILQNVVGATREWIDVVCCGHYHNSAEHTYQGMKLYVNGSLCGTGPYALKNRLFARPNQKLLIFDDNITDIDINL